MNDQNKGLDIERVKQIALDNGFQLKEQASGNYDLHSYVYQFAEKLLEDKQAEVNDLESRLAEHVKRNGLHPATLPDDICWWFHPDFKYIDPMADCHDERGYTQEEWQQIQDLGQVDITFDTSVSAFDIEEALGRETDGEWAGWKPEPPIPEHFLIAAFDTEHVECVLWWAKRRNNAEINELKAKLAKYEDPSPENLVAFSHAMYRRLASWASGQIPKELADLNLDDFVPMYAASAAVHSLTMDWTKETTHVIVPREPTPKMIDATWDIDDEIQEMSHNARNEAIYKHMIAAAQKHNQ